MGSAGRSEAARVQRLSQGMFLRSDAHVSYQRCAFNGLCLVKPMWQCTALGLALVVGCNLTRVFYGLLQGLIMWYPLLFLIL